MPSPDAVLLTLLLAGLALAAALRSACGIRDLGWRAWFRGDADEGGPG